MAAGDCSPAAVELLFNRNFVVDAGEIDALTLPDDASRDVNDDRDHVCPDEVIDGVEGLREGGPVQVVRVERPLVKHEGEECGGDDSHNGDQRQPSDLPARDWRRVVEVLPPPWQDDRGNDG